MECFRSKDFYILSVLYYIFGVEQKRLLATLSGHTAYKRYPIHLPKKLKKELNLPIKHFSLNMYLFRFEYCYDFLGPGLFEMVSRTSIFPINLYDVFMLEKCKI